MVINNEKIDWHDYDRIKRDIQRSGELSFFISIYFMLKQFIIFCQT